MVPDMLEHVCFSHLFSINTYHTVIRQSQKTNVCAPTQTTSGGGEDTEAQEELCGE